MDQANVLLIGGTGFIGGKVLEKLLKRGYNVTVLYRSKNTFSDDFTRLLQKYYENVKLQKGDVLLIDTLKECFHNNDINTVIYLACNSKWGSVDSESTRQISVNGVQNVLELLQPSQKLIYISSAAAMLFDTHFIRNSDNIAQMCKPEKFIYAKAKYDTEQLIMQKHKNYIILRPGEVYDKDDFKMVTAQNIRDYMLQPAFCIRGGVSICNRDDVAECIATCCQITSSLNKCYFLGGDNITIAQLARQVQKSNQNGHMLFFFPSGFALILSNCLKFLKMTLFEPEAVKYGQIEWYCDSADAVKDLGYVFRPSSQIIEEVVQWLNSRK